MMALYRDKYRTESTRSRGWDYTTETGYFVTICTRERECILGKIVDRRVRLSTIGNVALRYWKDVPKHFANADLDAFVVMPNHVHAIVFINTGDDLRWDVAGGRDVACYVSTTMANAGNVGASAGGLEASGGNGTSPVPPQRGSLGAIVRSYKSAVTRWCRINGYTSFEWQPRFYDRVIRDEAALQSIRRYILENAAKWELDPNNPDKWDP